MRTTHELGHKQLMLALTVPASALIDRYQEIDGKGLYEARSSNLRPLECGGRQAVTTPMEALGHVLYQQNLCLSVSLFRIDPR